MSDKGTIYQRLPRVAAKIGAISKARSGPGFKFRGIEDAMDAVHRIFTEEEVFVTMEALGENRFRDITKGAGKAWVHASNIMRVTFHASDGSSVSTTVPAEGEDNSDKASNKLISNALKYAIFTTFTVPYSEALVDSEADDSGEREVAPPRGSSPPPARPSAVPPPSSPPPAPSQSSAPPPTPGVVTDEQKANVAKTIAKLETKSEKTPDELRLLTWCRVLTMAAFDIENARKMLRRLTTFESEDGKTVEGWSSVEAIPADVKPGKKASALHWSYGQVKSQWEAFTANAA